MLFIVITTAPPLGGVSTSIFWFLFQIGLVSRTITFCGWAEAQKNPKSHNKFKGIKTEVERTQATGWMGRVFSWPCKRHTQTAMKRQREIRRRSSRRRPKLMHRAERTKASSTYQKDTTRQQKPRKCVEKDLCVRVCVCVCAGMCGLVFDFVLAAKLLSARILIMASLKCRTRKMFANKEADNKRCPKKRKMWENH